MLLILVIDFKDGQCVCFKQGDMDQVMIFFEDLVVMVCKWVDFGVWWFYFVDLNGVFVGKLKNFEVIEVIFDEVGDEIFVQFGGGICSFEMIEKYFDVGLFYVIIGMVVVKNLGFLQDVCIVFFGSIIVGLDVKDGKVVIDGWSKLIGYEVIDFVKKFEDYGVELIVYMDIGCDGMLQGINIDVIVKFVQVVGILVIVSGGLLNFMDIESLCEVEEYGVEGVICGCVIYFGDFDFVVV